MLTNINYYNNMNNFEENENYLEITSNSNLEFSSKEINAIDALASTLLDKQSTTNFNEYTLLIPKEWARGESHDYIGTQNEVEKVPHYELHIEPQIGSWKNRRDAYVYLRLPKSKMLINIILHMDGGVSFDKKFHKYVLREMDELDRRIILGFCDKYFDILLKACYSEDRDPFLDSKASTYQALNYKKRIKSGSKGNDMTEFHRKYNGGFEPYEESSSIFRTVHFLN